MADDLIKSGFKENIPGNIEKNKQAENEKIRTQEIRENFEFNQEKNNDSPVQEASGNDEMGSQNIVIATNYQNKSREREKQIEKIMEEGLAEIYTDLTPEKRREFRHEGEKVAKEINSMFDKAKFKLNKIIDLIKGWLSVIPGVNRFFLEQMAKIKSDEIMRIKKDG